MKSFLIKEAKQLDKEDCAECVILIIMSHGSGTKVFGVDGLGVELKSLTNCFSTANCGCLHEKPRLVFVQACRSCKLKELAVRLYYNTQFLSNISLDKVQCCLFQAFLI